MKRLTRVVKLSLLGLLLWGASACAQSPADLPAIWAVGQDHVSPELLRVIPPTPAPDELTLQDAVRFGLERNISFRGTIQDLLDARSAYYVARQRWNLTLVGDAARSHTESGSATTYDLGPQFTYAALTGGTFSVSAELHRLDTDERTSTLTASFNQPLLAGAGKASAAYEAVRSARNTYRAALLQYFTDRQNLLVTIIGDYFGAVEQGQLLDVQASNVRAAEEQEKNVQARFNAQLVVQLDLLRVQIQLADAQQSQVAAQQSAQDAMDRLLALIGLQVGGTPRLVTAVPYKPVSVDVAAAVQEALTRRPELRLADLTIENRVAGLRISRSFRLPTLDAFGNYQRLHSDIPDEVTTGWTLGLNLSVPIASRSLKEAVRQSEWALLVAQQQREDTKQQVVLDVRSQVRAAASAQAQADIAIRNLEVANLSVYDATLMVQEGLSTTLDLVNAQTSLVQTQTSVVQSRVGYYLATVRLKRAIGRDVGVDLPTERATAGTAGPVAPGRPAPGATPAAPGTSVAPTTPGASPPAPPTEAAPAAGGGTEGAPSAPQPTGT